MDLQRILNANNVLTRWVQVNPVISI